MTLSIALAASECPISRDFVPWRLLDAGSLGVWSVVIASLIEFARQAADRRDQRRLGKPESLNFIGFTDCDAPPPPALPALNHFAGTLAGVCARLGADVDRYCFTVRDSLPSLLASLPAHFKSQRISGHSEAALKC